MVLRGRVGAWVRVRVRVRIRVRVRMRVRCSHGTTRGTLVPWDRMKVF